MIGKLAMNNNNIYYIYETEIQNVYSTLMLRDTNGLILYELRIFNIIYCYDNKTDV